MKKKLDVSRCRTCIYRGGFWLGGRVICCDYILDEGKSRGDPGGQSCRKYVEGDPDTKRRKRKLAYISQDDF